MNKVIVFVGMPGSGKSEITHMFESAGFVRLRFGDETDLELKRRGLEINEKNEKFVREDLRKQKGMGAYAILIWPRTSAALEKGNVVLDGMRSYAEYAYLKERLGDDMVVCFTFASPATRYSRLAKRKIRPLTKEECQSRDRSEIKDLDCGGPIAMADFVISNEGSMEDMEKSVKWLLEKVK